MNQGYKKGMWTVLIYALLLLTGYLLNQIYPTASCGPGLGLVYIITVVPLAILLLLIKDLFFLLRGKKEYYLSVILHLLVVCMVLIAFTNF